MLLIFKKRESTFRNLFILIAIQFFFEAYSLSSHSAFISVLFPFLKRKVFVAPGLQQDCLNNYPLFPSLRKSYKTVSVSFLFRWIAIIFVEKKVKGSACGEKRSQTPSGNYFGFYQEVFFIVWIAQFQEDFLIYIIVKSTS